MTTVRSLTRKACEAAGALAAKTPAAACVGAGAGAGS